MYSARNDSVEREALMVQGREHKIAGTIFLKRWEGMGFSGAWPFLHSNTRGDRTSTDTDRLGDVVRRHTFSHLMASVFSVK